MSDDYDSSEDEYIPRSSSSLPMILAALGVGTVVGAIIGFMASPSVEEATNEEAKNLLPVGACKSAFTDADEPQYRLDWYASEDSLTEDQRKLLLKQLDAEEQLRICDWEDEETKGTLLGVVEANRRLEDANRQLLEAEQQLAAMAKEKKTSGRAWEALKAKVATLEKELEEVKEERDKLQVALDQTVVQLEAQIEQTREWKDRAEYYQTESIENQWGKFTAEAKVAICTDRLRKKNRIECQELIDLNLNKDLELRYSQCIRSAETPPILKEFGKKDIRPLYTEPLGDKGYLKDWGIVFCDPTLPEAGGL